MSTFIKRDRDGDAINPPQVGSRSTSTPVSSQYTGGAGGRLFAGLAVAMTADALNVAFPMLSLPVDFVTAVLISFIFGWRWETIVVVIPEVIPVISMFPTWVIFVLYLSGARIGRAT